MHALGVTHVVFDEHEWEREHREKLYSWSAAERARFERFLAEHVEEVARFGDDWIGRVRAPR